MKAPWLQRCVAAAPVAIVLLGIALRLRQLAELRSLWMDEAMLAINIVARPLSQLAAPLDYNQGAPLGFLLLQKLATLAFGESDVVLRLLPLACSIAALVLFARVATSWLGHAGLLALAWMAFSTPVVDYSTEAKQYSSDLFVTVLLLWAAGSWLRARESERRPVLLAVIGAAALWLSHPAAFVLPGIAVAMMARELRPLSARRAGIAAMVVACWALSFLAVYKVSLASLAANRALLRYWQPYFLPPDDGSAGAWTAWALRSFVEESAGLEPAGAVLFLAGAGIVSMAWRRPALAAITLMPIAFALAASAAGLYPFGQRLLIFAVPCLLLLAAEGVQLTVTMTKRVWPAAAPLAALALGLVVLIGPVQAAWHRLVHPRVVEHLRPALEYLHANRRQGDGIYVYYGAKPAFRFYARSLAFDRTGLVPGRAHRDDPDAYLPELDALRTYPRVWLVVSHDCPGCPQSEHELLKRAMADARRLIDAFETPGAGVYLFSREGS